MSSTSQTEFAYPSTPKRAEPASPPRRPRARRAAASVLSPVRTTVVYDSYWAFARERQEMLLRRAANRPGPWTLDPILRRHRFTNAYRAADRVSQYLIRHVIYGVDSSPEDTAFRILLFKLFNKIETWELLVRAFGQPAWKSFDFAKYRRTLSAARQRGQTVYSAAYIMPSGRSAFGADEKHSNHLALLEQMMRSGLTKSLAHAKRLSDVYEMLRGYPTLGPFLAFQFAIDLNYSELIDFPEDSFVVPGPGARDGIAKCFADRRGLSEVDLIKLVFDHQDEEFAARGLAFERLGGRPLQLIDCQNLFCEVDKYARVMHPEVVGRTGRTRIKQVFAARSEPVQLWFPPKWGINDRVGAQVLARRQ